MKTAQLKIWITTALACGAVLPLPAALVVNGGFESGLAGWTRVDQIGSDGSFFVQSGTLSPVNGFTVPPPPGGTNAAMTDAAGPGSHVLYQDFLVSGGLNSYTLQFSLFINNGAGTFITPATLDFSTPALNQRARVDIIKTTADPFSMAPGDILQTLFETTPGTPPLSGYTSLQVDVSALLQANQGTTLRLRFAEVDNVAPFNLGVDNVDVRIGTAATVPDSLSWPVQWLALLGVTAIGDWCRRRAQRQPRH